MKKIVIVALVIVLMIFVVGCNQEHAPAKLVELEKYSAMTIDGTTSIEVEYTYVNGEETVYEFVIEDEETIGKLMAEIFSMELKDYPKDRDYDVYYREITVIQDEKEYAINLFSASDQKEEYLCQSQKVCEIIEKYIEDNLLD